MPVTNLDLHISAANAALASIALGSGTIDLAEKKIDLFRDSGNAATDWTFWSGQFDDRRNFYLTAQKTTLDQRASRRRRGQARARRAARWRHRDQSARRPAARAGAGRCAARAQNQR